MDPECKICLVSHMPMVEKSMLHLQLKKRPFLNNELEIKKGSATGDVTGLQGNAFAVNSWKDFYTLSVNQTEMGVK